MFRSSFILLLALMTLTPVFGQSPNADNHRSEATRLMNQLHQDAVRGYQDLKAQLDSILDRVNLERADQDPPEYLPLRRSEQLFDLLTDTDRKLTVGTQSLLELLILIGELDENSDPVSALSPFWDYWQPLKGAIEHSRAAALTSFRALAERFAHLLATEEVDLPLHNGMRPATATQVSLGRMARAYFNDKKVREKLVKLRENMQRLVDQFPPAKEMNGLQAVFLRDKLSGFANEVMGQTVTLEVNCVDYYINSSVLGVAMRRTLEEFDARTHPVKGLSDDELISVRDRIWPHFRPIDEALEEFSAKIVSRGEWLAQLEESRKNAEDRINEIIELVNANYVTSVREEVDRAFRERGADVFNVFRYRITGQHDSLEQQQRLHTLIRQILEKRDLVQIDLVTSSTIEGLNRTVEEFAEAMIALEPAALAILTDVAEFEVKVREQTATFKMLAAIAVSTIAAVPTGGGSFALLVAAGSGSMTYVALTAADHRLGRPTSKIDYARAAGLGAIVGISGPLTDAAIVAAMGRSAFLKATSNSFLAASIRHGGGGSAGALALHIASKAIEGENPFSPDNRKRMVHDMVVGGAFGFSLGVILKAGGKLVVRFKEPVSESEQQLLVAAARAGPEESQSITAIHQKVAQRVREEQAPLSTAEAKAFSKLNDRTQLGGIRSPQELTMMSTYLKVQSKLLDVTEAQASAVVEELKTALRSSSRGANLNASEIENVVYAYIERTTDFGNPQAMRAWLENLPSFTSDFRILADGGISLGNHISYLGNKYYLRPPSSVLTRSLREAQAGDVLQKTLVIDETVLSQISSNPILADDIVQFAASDSIRLLEPLGWAEMNLMKQLDFRPGSSYTAKASQQIERAVAAWQQSDGSLDMIASINKVLASDARSRLGDALRAAGVDEARISSTVNKLLMTKSGLARNVPRPSTPEHIVQRLESPQAAFDVFESQLGQIDTQYRQAFLEIYDRHLQIFSSSAIARDVVKIVERAETYAQSVGIPAEKIYYHAFQSYKSNGLIGSYMVESGAVPAGRMIGFRDRSVPSDALIVMIDDFNMSGSTFEYALGDTLLRFPNNRLAMISLADTEVAFRRVEGLIPATQGRAVQLEAVNRLNQIEASQWYQTLTVQEQYAVNTVMAQRGHNGGSVYAGTWYMTPDNNIQTSLSSILKKFLVDVKGYKPSNGFVFEPQADGELFRAASAFE
jgi:hypothetical protein